MKIKSILAGAMALGFMSPAFAQTDITITGATAFRHAIMLAIFNAYNSVGGGLGSNFNVAHNFPGNATNQLSQLLASNRAIFRGTFPGITGETIIRTTFSGSGRGLAAIAGTQNETFLQAVALPSGITPNHAGPTHSIRPKFSFSDIFQATTPVTTPTLNPVGASAIGVVTFTMLANESAPAHFTNVTQQQFEALLFNGAQPLSLFTGVTTDTTPVFATGRNDGSGTRGVYLTEVGYGVANPVNQYIATVPGLTTPGAITAITLVPVGGTGPGNLATSGGASNISDQWGLNVLGNGGYSSGSALRDHMGRTTANVNVFNGVDQVPDFTGPLILVTLLSTADAIGSVAAGARLLSYNGVGITPLPGGFSAADTAKITNGQYSAWSYQHLYHHGSLSANEAAWRAAFVGTWMEPALIHTANGIPLSAMGSSRPDDGFPIVAPIF